MVQSLYEDLFTSEISTSVDTFLDAIPSKVTDEMNENLCKPYTNEEIGVALFQMSPTKALALMVLWRRSIRRIGSFLRKKFAKQ
jgi:hypothetical protein